MTAIDKPKETLDNYEKENTSKRTVEGLSVFGSPELILVFIKKIVSDTELTMLSAETAHNKQCIDHFKQGGHTQC